MYFKMNIEELKKIVRGNGFQYIYGSTTIVIDVETVIDLLDDLKQCDIPVVVPKGTLCDVCGCENTITVSHKGENCDWCNPL
jgi:hypothetical protein